LSTFLTKSPAIPQQLYKTASHSLSAIAELLVIGAVWTCGFVHVQMFERVKCGCWCRG